MRNDSPLRSTIVLIGTALLAFVGTQSTTTAEILIDWNTVSTPQPAAGQPAADGRYWNSLRGGSGAHDALVETALIYSTGTETGYSVAVSFGTSSGNQGSGWSGVGVTGGLYPFDEDFATSDGIYNNLHTYGDGDGDATATITLTGLNSSFPYDFLAIGGRPSGGVDGIIEIMTGTSENTSYTLLNNGTILDFTVKPDLAGKIVLNFRKGSNPASSYTAANFNAMSFTQVPEPSALCLAMLALLGLAFRRRRR